jgi:hypothetical protein
MMKVMLSDQAHQHLVEALKTTTKARLRVRRQATLMAARGRPHGLIAEALAVSVLILQRWLNRYQQRGPAGLAIRWAPGASGEDPSILGHRGLGGGRQGPAGCGLDRAN